MCLLRAVPCSFPIFFLLAACGPSERHLTGQVFIVTQGGDNKKLALVEVFAFPETSSEVLTYFKTAHAALVEGRPPAEAAHRASKKAFEEARERDAQEEKTVRQLLDFARDPYKEISARRAALSKASIHTERLQRTSEEVELRKKQLADAIKNQMFWLSSELYFRKLPTHLASVVAKTDADGKFTMRLPSGRYILAAAATRKTAAKTKDTSGSFGLVRLRMTNL